MAESMDTERCTPYTKLPLQPTSERLDVPKFRVHVESTDSVLSAYSADDAIHISGQTCRKRSTKSSFITMSLIFMNFQLLGYLIYHFSTEKSSVPTCTGGEDVPHDSLITDHGLFSELNLEEIRSVEKYMRRHSGIVIVDDGGVDTAGIALIELWLPKKAEALQFLDNNGTRPIREARVVVTRGDLKIPQTEEYIVSPLPDPASHRLLNKDDDKRQNPMKFHTRPGTPAESRIIREISREVAVNVDRILRNSYKMSAVECDGIQIACVRYDNAAPGSLVPGVRRSWYRFLRDEDGHYLHPTAFQFLIDYKHKNSSKWRVVQYFYEGYYANDLEDLLQKFDDGYFKAPLFDYPFNMEEPSLKHRGRNMDEKLPPWQYYPQGKRYIVKGNSISYMNWKFQYSFFTSLGLQLYNINFDNERIVYEIGAQEVAVLYSGITPVSYTTNFFDSQYLLGSFSFEMVPEVDCPQHASFIDAVVFKVGRPVRLKNAICVFEHSNSIPLRRHYEMTSYNYLRTTGQFQPIEEKYGYYGGMNDNVLIVRTIAALFNYDYIFDYIFHSNGVIEARVTPTGYVHTAPMLRDTRQDSYGFHIFGNALASIHNHLIHFKVDMDVKGITNRFETLDIVPDSIKLNWTDPTVTLHQRKFVKTLRSTEKMSALKYDFEKPKKYLITTSRFADKYGNAKSWQIGLEGMSKLLIPEGEGIEPGMAWARYQLAVTKRKENERSSSSLYNGVDPYEAAVDFSAYIEDNDSLVDEDLVLWPTLGTMHIPGTADVPNTPTTNGHLTLRISPFNYFLSDPSMRVQESVYIEPGKVDKHGNNFKPCVPKYKPFEYDGREIEL